MASSLKQFRKRALARSEVKRAYDAAEEEFAFLDEVLKARAQAGLTQAELAARIGTTQSAIARLESAQAKHSHALCMARQKVSLAPQTAPREDIFAFFEALEFGAEEN